MSQVGHSERLYRKLLWGDDLSARERAHARTCAECQAAIAAAGSLDERLRAAARPLAAEPMPAAMTTPPLLRQAGSAWVPAVAGVAVMALAVGLMVAAIRLVGIAPATSSPTPSPSGSHSASPKPSAKVASTATPGSPVSNRAETGNFRLDVRADRAVYSAGEPINVRAALTYLGSDAITAWASGSGLVLFTVQGGDPPLRMGGAATTDCRPYTLAAGVPLAAAFRKSGAYAGDDPNAAFYRAYFADPLLRLPAGTWTITALASFTPGGKDCAATPLELSTSIKVQVVP